MGRNVLVVSTVEHTDAFLREHIEEDDAVKIVVPVVRQGFLDWLANDEKAFSEAEQVAQQTAEELPGEAVEAVAGEANVGLAVRDALATFPADEILVVVRPDDKEWVADSVASSGITEQLLEGIPVRYAVVGD